MIEYTIIWGEPEAPSQYLEKQLELLETRLACRQGPSFLYHDALGIVRVGASNNT